MNKTIKGLYFKLNMEKARDRIIYNYFNSPDQQNDKIDALYILINSCLTKDDMDALSIMNLKKRMVLIMNEKKIIADKELKETIDKLLSDAGILLQIVSKLQDTRYLYLTDAAIDTEKLVSEVDELEDKLQMIEIFG